MLLQGGPSPLTSPRGSSSGPSARPAAAAASRSTAVRGSAAGKPPAGAGRASMPAAAGGGGAAAAGGGGDAVVDESALSGGLLNEHEAKSRLGELLGEELVAALADAQWKVRRLLTFTSAAEAVETAAPVVRLARSHAASRTCAVVPLLHFGSWQSRLMKAGWGRKWLQRWLMRSGRQAGC